MKIVISSDEHLPLIDVLLDEVQRRGHEARFIGPGDWPEVTRQAIEEIQQGRADEGIVLCWTGTGCSIVANKMPGIRAALCVDAETAKGARIWNHANVLALSLRLTSPTILKEILSSWFDTPFSTDAWNLQQVKQIE